MKKNAGFTLIELVAVMVILAILAVVAIPQFVDLRVQAADAGADGVGGAIASATALNFATGAAGQTATATMTCAAAGTLLVGGVPDGYTVAEGTAPSASGKEGTCTVIKDDMPAAHTARPFSYVGCANATCS
jgi:prepilin-type N-terminal cleavage/methylation domain